MNTHNITPDTVPLPVEMLPIDKLVSRAGGEFRRIVNDANAKPTPAVVVNYIRHKLTPYDKARKRFYDDKAQHKIGVRVLKAIADRYAHVPVIATEARRQLNERHARFAAAKVDRIRAWRAA